MEGKKLDIHILTTSRIDDKKSSNLLEYKQTFHEIEEEEPVKPVQINIYQSNGKDLAWLSFDYEPKLQEKQQLKDQQSSAINICFCSLSNISVITPLVLGVGNMALKSINFRV